MRDSRKTSVNAPYAIPDHADLRTRMEASKVPPMRFYGAAGGLPKDWTPPTLDELRAIVSEAQARLDWLLEEERLSDLYYAEASLTDFAEGKVNFIPSSVHEILAQYGLSLKDHK